MSETIEQYHANPAISHSKLECYRRRPALYFKKYVARSGVWRAIQSTMQTALFRSGLAPAQL